MDMKQIVKINCEIEFDPDKPLSEQLNIYEIKDIMFECLLETGDSYNLILKLLAKNNPDLILHLFKRGVDSFLDNLDKRMDNFIIK